MTAQPNGGKRRPLRVLPWWVALVGAAAVATSITITTLWLLSIAGRNPSLRIEAIKIGLTVGAGTGGALALLLAIRRQWLSERTQAHAEDVAHDNTYDATQRRVTDLYGKAVEQLGHDRAAVRLGGLYSLERLAQDHIEHRQTVADVVCAYLRMPFRLPADTQAHASADDLQNDPVEIRKNELSCEDNDMQELQVRLAAQRILTRHLQIHSTVVNQSRQVPETHWADIRIDLTGAVLINLDFSRCMVSDVDFRRVVFHGITSFRWVQVRGSAWFHRAQFLGQASFRGAQFFAPTRFDQAQFSETTRFDQAQFGRGGWFNQAQFSADVTFSRAKFSEGAWFRRARFKDARFDQTQFCANTNFYEAQFGWTTWYQAKFSKSARFNRAKFNKTASFDRAEFGGDTSFCDANFNGGASFDSAQFTGEYAKFDRAQVMGLFGWPAGWRVQLSSPDGRTGQLVHDQTQASHDAAV